MTGNTPSRAARRRREVDGADNVSDRTYCALRDLILRCELAPGARIVEAEIARKLGISRSPLRESLRRLEEERFVEDLGDRHKTVAALTPEGVLQLYELRAVLECHAADRAEGIIPSSVITEAKAELDDLRVELMQGRSDKFLEADFAFHHIYIRRCGNHLIVNQLSQLEDHLRRLWTFVGNRAEHNMLALEEHVRILDAMQSPAPGRLSAAVREHVLGVGRRVAYFVGEKEASDA